MATGHYARLEGPPGARRLFKGADPAKDQSYFLIPDHPGGLDFVRFPLGGMSKQQVRELAVVAGLPVVVTDVCGYAHHIKASRGGLVLPSPFEQDLCDRAVMRMLDGVYRADCREAALLYAHLTDLYSMHKTGAALIDTTYTLDVSGAGSPARTRSPSYVRT